MRLLRPAVAGLAMTMWLGSLTSVAFAEQAPLKEVPPLPQGTVLFKGEAAFAQRGRIGGFALKPSKYGIWRDPKTRREGSPEEPIRIRYFKAPDPSFVGVYIVIVGDLSSYAALSFWVKGIRGGEAFEIGMNDAVSNKREDAVMVGSIHRYLPGGVTLSWQQVRIPVEDFFGPDLSRVYSLVFAFNEEGTGEFWIEGLSFHKEQRVDREAEWTQRGELLLDNFDHSDLNLLGRKANAFKRLPSVCEFKRVLSKPVPGTGQVNRALRLDWTKQSTGWCGYYTLLNQIDGENFDLSAYKEVRFWVRGQKGGETFELGMADKSWQTIGDSVKAGRVEKYLPEGVTTDWQEVVIPLVDFGKLDWSQMGSFEINFSVPGQGTVFIDHLRFIRKTQEDLLKEWEE